ncbi:hypothetical protein L917_10001, partial [Phytophthora nicotianae]
MPMLYLEVKEWQWPPLYPEAQARVYTRNDVFMNSEGNYPIRGVPDSIPGVCYRSSSKGWRTQKLCREYLKERRVMRGD